MPDGRKHSDLQLVGTVGEDEGCGSLGSDLYRYDGPSNTGQVFLGLRVRLHLVTIIGPINHDTD